MRGTRALKFRSRDSPFERELGGNSSRFKAYLRTQIFETVLFAGLWRGNGTRVERGEKKRKERLKGERKREGRRRRRRKEGPVSVLFRVIATRTEASKGFVLRFHSWVALRGLLSFALFCASFFLIDGRVNRSCSPRLENACRLQFPLLRFRRGATRGQFNVTGVNVDEKRRFSVLLLFLFFSFFLSSPLFRPSLLCHLQ